MTTPHGLLRTFLPAALSLWAGAVLAQTVPAQTVLAQTVLTQTVPSPHDEASGPERLADNRAGAVVRRAIGGAGGWEAWTAKRTVSLQKTTVRFSAEGRIDSQTVELHRYALHPGPKMRIDGRDGSREVVLVNDGQQAWKLVDGRLAEGQQDRDRAWNATFGSHYLFCIPFKLTDPGAVLADAGRTKLPDGTLADAVRVTYEPGAGNAAGLHVWTYYFDAGDSRLVAYYLKYGSEPDEYRYTEYADHQWVDGIYMPTRRTVFQSNARGERLAKLSEISYQDIRFDTTLGETLFAEPSGAHRR